MRAVVSYLGSYADLVQYLRNFCKCTKLEITFVSPSASQNPNYAGIFFPFIKYIITMCIYVKIEKGEEVGFLSHAKLF